MGYDVMGVFPSDGDREWGVVRSCCREEWGVARAEGHGFG